ncbi:hypothetical protein VCHENC01_2167 [Vibrio harveyi]|nr:hypothetical protein VCHENC01_2167 [Vibrio harveyi]
MALVTTIDNARKKLSAHPTYINTNAGRAKTSMPKHCLFRIYERK